MAVNFGLLGLQEHAARQERKDVRGQQAFSEGLLQLGQAGRAKAERELAAEQLAQQQRLQEQQLSQKALESAKKLSQTERAQALKEKEFGLKEKEAESQDITKSAKKQDQALSGFAEIMAEAARGDKPALLESFKKSLALAGVPQESLDELKNEQDLHKELIERGLKVPKKKELSSEKIKLKSMAVGAMSGLQQLGKLKSLDLIVSKIPGTDKAKFEAVRRSLVDTISRLRSGAAVTQEEFENFSKLVPQIQDSPATKRAKVEQLVEQFSVIADEFDIDPAKFGFKPKEVDQFEKFSAPADQLFIERMKSKGASEDKILEFLNKRKGQ